MRQTKIVLSDKEIPTKWYNIMADMPNLPKPPLHPARMEWRLWQVWHISHNVIPLGGNLLV